MFVRPPIGRQLVRVMPPRNCLLTCTSAHENWSGPELPPGASGRLPSTEVGDSERIEALVLPLLLAVFGLAWVEAEIGV